MKAFKRISKRYYLKHILICALIELMLFFAPLPALLANPNPSHGALPTGHSTPYGGVGSFNYDNTAHTLDITNVANRAVINWQKFDIGQSAAVTFQQASSSAYVLNRVNAIDGMASGIKGKLNANGGVIIVNPRGIVFGPSALINAGKFIASGLGISDGDFRSFANGDTSILKFNANYLSGSVINNGTINANESVYLAGKSVTNTGTISCPGGMVVMAAGEKVFLNHLGSRVFVEKLDTGYRPGDHKVTAGGDIDVTGGGVLLAAGDILSQAVITNAASFVAQANQNVEVTGDIDAAGDVQLYADYDHVEGGDFHSTAPIAATGNIEVRGNDVLFDETVDAGGDLTIVGRDCHPPEWQWGNVTAMKTLTAGGNILISDTGEKEKWINGHWEWHCGRCEWIPGYWETTYEPGTIFLHDDITAGGNIMLCNNTETYNDTGNGVRLAAGRNVILAEDGTTNSQRDNCEFLHGRNNLEIVALNGQITNDSSLFANPDAEPAMPGASLTTISVEGSTLLMEQAPSVDLDNFTFANQSNTDLTLVSNNGSVTAVETGTKPENAADQWNSIGATAQTDITLSGQGSIRSGNSGTAGKSLWAKTGNISVTAGQDFSADKDIDAGGNITAAAGDDICLAGNVTAAGNLVVVANPENTGSNVFSWGKLSSGWDMLVEAGQNIFLGNTPDSAISGGHMTLSAGEATGHETGELMAAGNLQATGDITLSSSGDTTYLGGNVTAGHDIILKNNTKAIGFSDQTLQASNKLTAFGYVRKAASGDMYLIGNSENGAEKSIDLRYTGEGPGTSTSHGNLWILGENDIQISGDVTTFGPSCFGIIQSEIPGEQASGGVAIISETGSIYTDGADGALNVSVTGSSDHKALDYRERGVYGFAPPINSDIIEPAIIEKSETSGEAPEPAAAIAIVSAKELKIGDGARLEARGIYYDGAEVDDRGAIGFLDFDAEIPEGTSRNQGVPFDLAIYTASRDGSVTIDCPVEIKTAHIEPPVPGPTIRGIAPEQVVNRGAMVIDALDIVTLGEDFRQSLENGEVGDRLEVCSRITEWLDDAAGRLPFTKDLDLPKGYNYVMRGAGAENPDIGEGAPAWALEYRPRQDAAPIQQNQIKSMGCPALMNWVAKELGVEKDQIQIYVEGALAMSGDVQPCEICSQLKNSALMLIDADGSQMKALASVINEFAGSMPPSEEQMAMIAAAMNNPQEGSQYALAAQWLEALNNYVNILNKDLKLSMDESVALAQKYASPAENSGNAALAAYIQAQLLTIGG